MYPSILDFVSNRINGWFQKISIPIPQVASRNSEGEGGYIDWNSKTMGVFIGLEFRRHGGGFQESIFQFGVVKSLK